MFWKIGLLWAIAIVALFVMWFVGRAVSRREYMDGKKKVLFLQRYFLIVTAVLTILYFCVLIFTGLLDDLIRWTDSLLLGKFGFLVVLLVGILPLLVYMVAGVIVMLPAETSIRKRPVPRSEVWRAIALLFLIGILPMLMWPLLIAVLPSWLTDAWWKILLWLALYMGILFTIAPMLFMALGDRRPVDEPLRTEIMEFAARLGCPVRDVLYKGPEGSPPNAMVSGILPGYRYIFISPSLVRDFSREEVMAIIAHEIGHIKCRHLLKNYLAAIGSFLAVFGGIMGLVCILKDHIGTFTQRLPVNVVAAAAGIIGMLLALCVYLLQGWLATLFEYEADAFAARVVSPDATMSALQRLSDLGLVPEKRDRILNILFRHPSIHQRIERLRKMFPASQPS